MSYRINDLTTDEAFKKVLINNTNRALTWGEITDGVCSFMLKGKKSRAMTDVILRTCKSRLPEIRKKIENEHRGLVCSIMSTADSRKIYMVGLYLERNPENAEIIEDERKRRKFRSAGWGAGYSRLIKIGIELELLESQGIPNLLPETNDKERPIELKLNCLSL